MTTQAVPRKPSALLTLLSKLPIPALRSLGRLAAWAVCTAKLPKTDSGECGSGVRWRVRVNSYIAYPKLTKTERDAFEVSAIKNHYMAAAEAVKSWGNAPEFSIAQIKTVHNREVFDRALKHPNGMIAVVLHMGTWEMMNAWLNQFGAPTIMYKPIKNQAVNDFMLAGRQRLNATLVPADATGVKAIFKTLKSGGFTIMLPDHKPEASGGVYAPLFGVHTLSSTLVSKLASKTDCAVIGLTCLRQQHGDGFEIFCDPIDAPDIHSKHMDTAVAALNTQIQAMIDRAPTHYMWNYERFRDSKNLPQHLGNVYQWSERELIDYFCSEKASTAHENGVNNQTP